MDINKYIDEMCHLADEMGKVVSTEYEKRVLADEKKLEAVLKENGWCKSNELAKEIFKDIDYMLSMMFEEYASLGHREYSTVIEVIYRKLKILEKKYTEEEKWK